MFEKLSYRSRALHALIEFETWLIVQESKGALTEEDGLNAITAKLALIVQQAFQVVE